LSAIETAAAVGYLKPPPTKRIHDFDHQMVRKEGRRDSSLGMAGFFQTAKWV
jgi:hypothetical protein